MNMLLHGNALLALAAAVLWGGGRLFRRDGREARRRHHGRGAAGDSAEPCGELHACWWRWRGCAGMRFRMERSGVGTGCRSDGGAFADVLLRGAVAGCDGSFGGVERIAGGGDSGGGVAWQRVAGDAADGGFAGRGAAIWLIAAGENPEAVKAATGDGLAGGGWREWGLGFILSR